MTWNGDFYVVPGGANLIHADSITNEHLRNMSMADYATFLWSQSSFPEARELSRHSTQKDLEAVASSQATFIDALKLSNQQLATQLREAKKDVTTLKEQLAEKSRIPAPVKEEPKPVEGNYSYWYWQFVKRTDPVEAAEAFSNMLEKVTINHQPVSEWHSRFPRTRMFIAHHQFFVKNVLTALFAAVMIAGILIGTA